MELDDKDTRDMLKVLGGIYTVLDLLLYVAIGSFFALVILTVAVLVTL